MTIKNLYGDDHISTRKHDTYGGIDVHISASPYLQEIVKWVEEFRTNEANEKLRRELDPNVKLAYDAYKMAVALSNT